MTELSKDDITVLQAIAYGRREKRGVVEYRHPLDKDDLSTAAQATARELLWLGLVDIVGAMHDQIEITMAGRVALTAAEKEAAE